MIGRHGGVEGEDRDLIQRAAAWERCPALRDCSALELREVALDQGLEFATALLYDRVLRTAEHRGFFERVHSNPAPSCGRPPLVGIVPGAFYRQHKTTGADGARLAGIAASMGCAVEVVPVDSFGSLSRNALLIVEWLRRRDGQPVLLISLSKGSADLKVALGLPGAREAFRNVAAWISLSGLPQGTPLVGWLRRQPLRRLGVRLLLRFRGQRYSVVEELRSEPGGPLAGRLELPPGLPLRIVHVVGFPLRRHLAHPWAARAYERVAPLGPNDGGGFLLGDVTRLAGTVFPVWGADHYLQPSWDATPLLGRVVTEVLAQRAESRQANQSAAHPINPPANRSRA